MENNSDLFIAQNIEASYGTKKVLHDISFSLQEQTLTGLIGANGCGKTTLLRCITGRMIHQGSCFLDGVRMECLSERQIARNISYIPQKSGIGISLPVIDVVLMGFQPVMKLFERPSKIHIQKAKKALREVGMDLYEETDYLTLSEGQKQLVVLARTMVEDSVLLLLDEPDSALDVHNRYRIMNNIRKLVLSGKKAGLLSLHDPTLAMEFCDQLLLLKDGRYIEMIRPKEDSLKKMEEAFAGIYENISLAEYKDKNGKKHIAMIWEE